MDDSVAKTPTVHAHLLAALALAGLLLLPLAGRTQTASFLPPRPVEPAAFLEREQSSSEKSKESKAGGKSKKTQGEGKGAKTTGSPAGGGERDALSKPELPSLWGSYFEITNPAKLQRVFEDWFDRPYGSFSTKPRAPEIPLALYRETIRPLGALQYENQLNTFQTYFSGSTPRLETTSYEYVFSDWNALRLELAYPDNTLESVAVGYQRTLGVGPEHNWAHGFVVIPEFSVKERFVGVFGFYTFAWKPTEESPWSVTASLGGTRSSFAGVAALATTETANAGGSMGGLTQGDTGKESSIAAWRSFMSCNAFYALTPRWTLGIENDAFPHDRFGEYLVMPLIIYRPTQRFFVQAGAGYYELRGESQATLMVRVNLLNPSPRKPREVWQTDAR